MKKRLLLISILFVILISGVESYSQEFNASVDKTTVSQSDRFQAYFEFSGGDINSIRNFKPPGLSDFRVISGPNQSTSMQIINGRVSGSITYSYILQPKKQGEFTIGSSSLEYGGNTYSTDPIKIKVTKGRAPQQQSQSTGGVSNEDLAKNVFIVASPDKRNVFKGEQITVTYKLYTRLNISSPQISKLPTNTGFWAEELDMSNNINFNIEMYKGERYRAAVIKRAALFPTKTGELTVTPFELKVPVIVKRRRSTNDIFDDFFNDSFFGRSETVEYLARSNTIKINVTPLPSTDVPASFSGAVGKFNFQAEMDKNEVDVNEAITLKLGISGNGNIKLLDLPDVKLPPGFEQYEPKLSERINRTNIVSGQKYAEYLIVPRIPGKKEIPAIEFSFFDPAKKKYFTMTSPTYSINVNKGEAGYDMNVSGFSKEDVKLLSQDIRFIKTSSFNLRKKGEFASIKSWFWIGAIFPLLILFTVLGVKKRQDKLSGNVKLLKYRKAEKKAKNRLRLAKKELETREINKFYSELSQAVFGYLEDKLSLQKSEFSLDKAVSELEKRDIENGLISKVKTISEKCEFARFAPDSSGNGAAKELYDETIKTIIDLENSISSGRKKR